MDRDILGQNMAHISAFCFEYTNILYITMSDRRQNLKIFIFRCMGKKQLQLKMLRMKKSLNRSNYVVHINSSAFRRFIQMLQSMLENINCFKKTVSIISQLKNQSL